MDTFTREALTQLIGISDDPCLSLYMPTHRAGQAKQQDPIRFKNMLHQAEELLRTRGVRKSDIDALLKPAADLLSDPSFWSHQEEGLALFLAPDQLYAYRLPLQFDELLILNTRFMIKPLLPMLGGDGRFYLLALSQNSTRLFEGTHYAIREIPLEGVPTSIEEALLIEGGERATSVNDPDLYQGIDPKSEQHKNKLFRYFRQVNNGLTKVIKHDPAPLVLAGVEYLLPIYQDANTLSNLVRDQGVRGNPEHVSLTELHSHSWQIVAPLFTQELESAAAEYHQQFSHTNTPPNTDLVEILTASAGGRVKTLFVDKHQQKWGVFDLVGHRIENGDQLGAEDLLDLAAVQTLNTNGTVYALEAESMPCDMPIAAVFRY